MKKARYERLRSELHKMDSEDNKTFQAGPVEETPKVVFLNETSNFC